MKFRLLSLLALTLWAAGASPLTAQQGQPSTGHVTPDQRRDGAEVRPHREDDDDDDIMDADRRGPTEGADLGIIVVPVVLPLAEHLGLRPGLGLQIRSVKDDGPADIAGLKSRDILTKLDGQPLRTPEQFALLQRSRKADDRVTLTFIRRGEIQEQTAEITVRKKVHASQPVPNAKAEGQAPQIHVPGHAVIRAPSRGIDLGVGVTPVSLILADHLGLASGFGLQISSVTSEAPPSPVQLQKHDILTKFDNQLLTTPEHLALLLRTKKADETVTFTLIRRGQEQTVRVELREKAPPAEAPGTPGSGGAGNAGAQRGISSDDQRDQERAASRMEGGNPQVYLQHRRSDAPAHSASSAERSDQPGKKAPGDEPRNTPARSPGAAGRPLPASSSNTLVHINTPEGSVAITSKDGEHEIAVRDKNRGSVHKTGFDPSRGLEALPEEVQEVLRLMKIDDLKQIMPPASLGTGTSVPHAPHVP